jgi:hypothetical protein
MVAKGQSGIGNNGQVNVSANGKLWPSLDKDEPRPLYDFVFRNFISTSS